MIFHNGNKIIIHSINIAVKEYRTSRLIYGGGLTVGEYYEQAVVVFPVLAD